MSEASPVELWQRALDDREKELLGCMAGLEHPHRMSPMGGNPVANRRAVERLVELGLAERKQEPPHGRYTYRATFYGRRVHQMIRQKDTTQ